METKTLVSELDPSVNFIEERLAGFLESRFVRKCDDYFICYLSSQNGCNRACKFCHLTVTGQTSFVDSTIEDFAHQAAHVFKHYSGQKPAKYMHYNFMARGEPLANKHILDESDELLPYLHGMAKMAGLPAKFNVSTIMPKTLKKSLVDVFNLVTPTIYYSLYSVDDAFRKEWLPTAMPVGTALDMLKEYQDFSKKIVKIHYSFIKDRNDSIQGVFDVARAIQERHLHCEFNVVRYNPASPEQGEESHPETIERIKKLFGDLLCGKVQVIPRVGFDVKASCGMFV